MGEPSNPCLRGKTDVKSVMMMNDDKVGVLVFWYFVFLVFCIKSVMMMIVIHCLYFV